MDHLLKMMRQLSNKYHENWTLNENYVDVQLGQGTRHQRVHTSIEDGFYFFTSVVISSATVRASKQRRNELALMAWQRNADHELITFAFDEQDRLVGIVRHPAEYLDLKELEFYVTTLTRECDRFEYLLAGGDRF